MDQVKGSKLTSKLEFVRHHFGEEALAGVLESLPAEDRAVLGRVLPVGWYELALYDRLIRAVCAVAAGGREEVYDRMGVDSAERQMSDIYGGYLKHDLLKTLENMVPMHAQLNRPGAMAVEAGPGTACTIVVREPRSTAASCRVSRAFYRRVAELSGVTGVEVAERTCTARGDDACRFTVRWQA